MPRRSWPDVRVACVWIAQLPLRVEILRHPAWDGRPLVLGGAPGERKVVQLCSPEAAAVAARIAAPEIAQVVPASETDVFLAPLSVRNLLHLEPDVLQRLELLGLHTIGELAALPFNAVQAEFGPAGAHAWRLAHGKD